MVSHKDTGVANWLDPSGHTEGYIALRWINADAYSKPVCEQVTLDALQAKLPPEVKSLSPAQRKEQLTERRRGVLKRFRY